MTVRNKQDSQRKRLLTGFTLLEVVVALAVILAAVIGPVAMVSRSVYSIPQAKNQLIAVNLAQEGIELIRVIRENNVICQAKGAVGWTWDRDYTGAAGSTIIGSNRAIDTTDSVSVGCVGGVTVTNPRITGACASTFLKLDASGRYGYLGNTPTQFTRCVTIARPVSPDGNISVNDILDVVSTVQWTDRNLAKNVTLQERLYNWR